MEKIDKSIIRSEASTAALLFGLISGGYDLLSPLIPHIQPAWLANIVSIVLWAAKFVGCIYLMKACMVRLSGKYEGVGSSELLRFGTLIALFSAIITAACSYVSLQYVYPNMLNDTLMAYQSQMGGMLDSNTRSALEQAGGQLPLISLFSNLIWCFVYGWILSRILSRNLGKEDFSDTKDNSDDDYI